MLESHHHHLRPKSLTSILTWWAQEIGVNVLELISEAHGVTISASTNLPGIFLFRRESDIRIAALAHKLSIIQEAIIGHTHNALFTPQFWRENLPDLTGETTAPAHLFYLDSIPENWTPDLPQGIKIRGIAGLDAPAFAALSGGLTQIEREHSGLELGPRPMWGAFMGGEMIAASGYDSWPGRIAHIGIAVHPAHRGQKIGQAVFKAAARGAIARRKIVQYRAIANNPSALGIMAALGIACFAHTFSISPPRAD